MLTIVAAAIWAVFPWFSQWANTYIWETNLSALLFLCLFWYALRLDRKHTLGRWLGFGALWGFAMLVNPALAPLFAVSLGWLAWRRSREQKRETRAMPDTATIPGPGRIPRPSPTQCQGWRSCRHDQFCWGLIDLAANLVL